MDLSREGTYSLKLGLFKPRCTRDILSGVGVVAHQTRFPEADQHNERGGTGEDAR